MTEFWSRTPWTDNRTVKMVSSAAHVYGKNVVAVEAFTGEAETSRWQDFPYSMKTLGDQMFAQGINQIFFHRSEEHTSELQSLMRISYAVFCLKKKKRYEETTTLDTYQIQSTTCHK